MKEKTPLPLENTPQHTRNIQVLTERLDKNHIQIRAELVDTRVDGYVIHHMVVRLTVGKDLIVKKAEFLTLRAPFLECSNHDVPADRLLGISAGKGFTKKVLEIYGGSAGCSHIVTILMMLAPAIRQGMVFSLIFPEEEKHLTNESIGGHMKEMAKTLEGSCMAWAKDSPVQRDVARGDIRTLPERIYPEFDKNRTKSNK